MDFHNQFIGDRYFDKVIFQLSQHNKIYCQSPKNIYSTIYLFYLFIEVIINEYVFRYDIILRQIRFFYFQVWSVYFISLYSFYCLLNNDSKNKRCMDFLFKQHVTTTIHLIVWISASLQWIILLFNIYNIKRIELQFGYIFGLLKMKQLQNEITFFKINDIPNYIRTVSLFKMTICCLTLISVKVWILSIFYLNLDISS